MTEEERQTLQPIVNYHASNIASKTRDYSSIEDYKQTLWLAIINRKSKYNKNKSSKKTFAETVCRNISINIINSHFRKAKAKQEYEKNEHYKQLLS